MNPSSIARTAVLAGLLLPILNTPCALSQGFGTSYNDSGENQYNQPSSMQNAPASRAASQQLSGRSTILFVTTTQNLDGYVVKQYLGVVRGVTVRQPTMGQNLMAGIQGMMTPNIDAYAQMCDQAREQSLQRLIQHAQSIGANAVVGLHYDSSPVNGTTFETEVLCYGTAVVVAPLR